MKSLAKQTYKMMIKENGGLSLMDWQIDEVLNLAILEGCSMTAEEQEQFEKEYLNKQFLD